PRLVESVTIDDVTNKRNDHLSYSQISMYLRCGMQYWFRYIQGLKEPPALAPSAGAAGHNAVEADHKRKIRTGMSMTLEEMLDYFSSVYDLRVREVEAKANEDKGRVKDDITSSLSVYHAVIAPKVLPVLVEKAFDLKIEGQNRAVRPVMGRIDLVSYNPKKKYGVWDNKFTMSRRTKSQIEIDTSIQLSTYDMAFEQETGKTAGQLGIIQFMPPGRNAATYPAEVKVIQRSKALMTKKARKARAARTIYQYETAEAGIAAGIFIPTDSPMVCGWCGYRERCQNALVSDYDAMRIKENTDDPTAT
ncbi:MAG: hypothetical protein DRR06_14645, partial [Gammaproteobacteria bacterium]